MHIHGRFIIVISEFVIKKKISYNVGMNTTNTDKKITDTKVNVSIITICFNAEAELPMTMESVLSQDYSDFEYIIKDGGSTDGSSEIINSYIPKFEEKGIRVIYVSEKDKGIYDAMNIAVTLTNGTWINFMNAGDCFYSADVLTKIFGEKAYSASAVIYGDCAEYEYGRFYLFPKSYENITSVMPFSHQAMFARRELLVRRPFCLDYRYSADYDFLLAAYDMELHFTDVNCVVCITNKDGVSSVNYQDMLNESSRILAAHNIPVKEGQTSGGGTFVMTLKQFVLDHFPTFIKKFIRGIQIKKRHQNFDYVVPPWHPAYRK